jgi:hypothetical protein
VQGTPVLVRTIQQLRDHLDPERRLLQFAHRSIDTDDNAPQAAFWGLPWPRLARVFGDSFR